MTPFVLGVDAGNTKTIAIVAQTDGSIIGAGRSECGDIYGTDVEEALDAIAIAAHDAMKAVGSKAGALSATVLSAAGADWPEDFETIRDGVIARCVSDAPIVYNDAIGGLRGGSPDGTGVVVACGTGTAVGSRSHDRRIWHSSFWQGPQGAAQLGEETLATVVRAELGLEPPTALTEAVILHLGEENIEAALHHLTARASRPRGPFPLKSLAKVLLDTAVQGDVTARHIVASHGQALGDYAIVAARKVGIEQEPFHLVLTGGVLRHASSLMRDAIVARVREASPNVQPTHSAFEPAVGAVMLALEAASVAIDDAVKNRLHETMPPRSLFET